MSIAIQGHCDARFSAAKAAFAGGFDAGREVGAALAIIVDDELVVDLWAGHTDRRKQRSWQSDTLCCAFSISKAVTATCVLQAVAEGWLVIDAPVARYWPEFACNGKEVITIRHLLSHRAGLVGFKTPVAKDLLYHWDETCAALAAESPWWTPGEAHGYHARTFGFLLGEVLRRSTGETPASWLAKRIAGPHELDFKIGLHADDLKRCADMLPARVRTGGSAANSEAAKLLMADFNDTSTPTGAAFQNPSLGAGYMNSDVFRMGELPAVNGHGTARSIARLFSLLPNLLPKDILDEATRTQSVGLDRVLKSTTRFGLGYMLHLPETPIGVGEGSFGHGGAGGSLAFYDPERKMGFCYLMNQMEQGVISGGVSAGEILLVACPFLGAHRI